MRRLALLALAVALSLGVGLAPGASARMRMEEEGARAGCWFAGDYYSHGAKRNQAMDRSKDGKTLYYTYECEDGEWVRTNVFLA